MNNFINNNVEYLEQQPRGLTYEIFKLTYLTIVSVVLCYVVFLRFVYNLHAHTEYNRASLVFGRSWTQLPLIVMGFGNDDGRLTVTDDAARPFTTVLRTLSVMILAEKRSHLILLGPSYATCLFLHTFYNVLLPSSLTFPQ